MRESLQLLLEHLLDVLDADRQAYVEDLHRRALDWEPVERLPVVMELPTPKELVFTPYPHGEVFHDPEKMLFNELVYAFNTSIASRDVLDDDLPCTIRANFGTVVIASLFGACVEQVDDDPPWVRHGDDDMSLQDVLDHDPLDFSQGWCPRVVEMYQFYQSVLSDYPELNQLIHPVLPDLQGPFDNLELIVGSNVFVDLCTDEELVFQALEAMATAQVGFSRHLAPYLSSGSNGFSHQHATTIRGNVLLRNDSVTMMSPEMYRRIVAPHDERVLRELNGGGIHSCGRAESHVSAFIELPSFRCLDLGQPELNDTEVVYRQLQERRTPLTRLKVSRQELATGRIMERFPTGVSLLYVADSILDAQKTMVAYLRSSQKRGPARQPMMEEPSGAVAAGAEQ